MVLTRSSRTCVTRPVGLLAWMIGLTLLYTGSASAIPPKHESNPPQPKLLATAIGAFSKEQSLAEGYVGLMETLGKKRFRDYANGIRLYATARAEFNSLLDKLKQQLIQRAPLTDADAFTVAMNSAVKRRKAFTGHVDQMLDALEQQDQQVRPGISDYLPVGMDLGKILIDAGKTIWQEYQKIQESKRQETLDQLESLKWQPFAKIIGKPL